MRKVPGDPRGPFNGFLALTKNGFQNFRALFETDKSRESLVGFRLLHKKYFSKSIR